MLVSEIMLQQTQVDRVVPYYGSFLGAFPTVSDCARARPADVVRLWSGLGYNRRALNLHRAAVVIVEAHGGVVPEDDRALRGLPGVGPYTARAIRSFAFGLNAATVDTNVVRVLARCVHGSPLTTGAAQELADRLVPAGQSWEFNQSMFDLGATVCTGSRPDCLRCPLRQQCRWRRRGLTEPDPWRASQSVKTQSRFAGSDRQGRGRLLTSLRTGTVGRDALAPACGWPDDGPRAERIAEDLVAEGFAEWTPGVNPVLQLR